jgi:hypothetical protein
VPADVMVALLASIDPRADLEDQYADDEVTVLAPSLADDPAFRSWWTRSARRAASPAMAREINRMVFSADMLSLLSRITVPALIVQRRELALFGAMQGRRASQLLPDCRYVELEGADMVPFCGDAAQIIDELREFLTGDRHRGVTERAFAVVLFTDIVGSTALVSEVGDEPGARSSTCTTTSSVARSHATGAGSCRISATGPCRPSPHRVRRCWRRRRSVRRSVP